MNALTLEKFPSRASSAMPSDGLTPLWIAGLYGSSDAEFKVRLLECLMRPLGALALVAIANGVFAVLRHRHGWQRLQVNVEDTEAVNVAHVFQLASYLQQAEPQALEQVAKLLEEPPETIPCAVGMPLLQVPREAHQRRRAL